MSWLMDLLNPGRAAAKEANKGADKARQEFQQAFTDVGSILEPYSKPGITAQTRLADLQGLNGATARTNAMANFQQDPGYQFAMDQGIQAIDRSAAARGSMASGQTLKALTEFGQGMANQQYGDWYNRTAGLADTGANAANSLATARQNTAAGVGSGYTQIGANNANAKMTGGLGSMIGGVASAVNKIFS